MKYSFKNDYSEMAHPLILKALSEAEFAQFEGYGLDKYCDSAATLIRQKLGSPDADIHFVSGGTQANLVTLSAALRPHEAIISAESGHIFVHETGAIEATGHKICTIKTDNGKITSHDIETVVSEHSGEHMVKPRLVYISMSTEIGTVYSKKELTDISNTCKRLGLILYLDGARLGPAICSPSCDLTYPDIARLVDAFFLGGTKNGCLYGEAVVIINQSLKADFRFHMKQKGALLSKSAAIGLQFKVLLDYESSYCKNVSNNGVDLYDKLAIHSNKVARKLSEGIESLGYEFISPAETNMIFPIFPHKTAELLSEDYNFYQLKKLEKFTTVRLVTSWATPLSMVDMFLGDLELIILRT